MDKSANEFKVSVINEFDGGRHFHKNVVLYFVIEGRLHIDLMRESYLLDAEDFIIINKNMACQLRKEGDALAAAIEFSYPMLCRLANKSMLAFRCNSTSEAGTKYEKFRYMVGELLNEYALDYSHMTFAKMSGLYNLCHYMVHYFGVTGSSVMEPAADSKVEKALQYTEDNFSRKISLEEVAGHVYMTPTSFSRFFHKSIGITYMEYLNQLRMDYAADALIHSGQSITEIALDCGFSNSSIFSKAFKKAYGVPPRQYQDAQEACSREKSDVNEDAFGHSLEKYRNKKRMTIVREQKVREDYVSADMAGSMELKNPWTGMLHLGHAPKLLSAEYQKQAAFLKQELGFEYGCLTGFFSEEMKLRKGHDTKALNFSYLDNVLDCLVENRIYPVITFDNQLVSLIRSHPEIVADNYEYTFQTLEECIRVIDQMICHFIYRYGEKEVGQWMFDLWYTDFIESTLGLKIEYAAIWDRIYECIRRHLPHAKIGGSGTGLSLGYERALAFYLKWKSAKHMPDFLSLNMFPYHQAENKEAYKVQRKNIKDFYREDMEQFKKVLRDCAFPETPIYVLQWNLSFVQRNYFNDSSGKAAIMLHQMAGNMEEAEKAAYWAASDLLAEDYDATKMLNGSVGLLSRDGICKPAFYAMEFISELLGRLVSKGEHHIVTADGRGHMVILLFNHKMPGYNYYAKDETEITLETVDGIYLEEDILEITLEIDNVEDGNYYVHKQTIGPDCGDVLNEWRHLGTDVPMMRKDVAYLRSRSVPYRKNDRLKVENHKMVLMERLAAHEMMKLQINLDVQNSP